MDAGGRRSTSSKGGLARCCHAETPLQLLDEAISSDDLVFWFFAVLIVVKVRSSFPPAYDEFVQPDNMHFIDTPGRTSPMLQRMPFQRLPRPVYPLDEGFEWTNPLSSSL